MSDNHVCHVGNNGTCVVMGCKRPLALPEGVVFENGEFWSTCDECGNQQADMGKNVKCEACGFGPMPTRSGG